MFHVIVGYTPFQRAKIGYFFEITKFSIDYFSNFLAKINNFLHFLHLGHKKEPPAQDNSSGQLLY